MTVAYHKIEEASQQQRVFYSAKHRRRVALTDLRDDYAHRKASFIPQPLCEDIRLSSVRLRLSEHAAGFLELYDKLSLTC